MGISKRREKKAELNSVMIHLAESLRIAAILLQPIMTEKSISFKIDLPKYPIYMYFDQDKIYKVMNNLLSNAYKFTPEYGEISIQLSEGEENFLFIKISDTGIGISEENLPHIFDRFYQISSKQCENTGSGIGLHLAKEYINLLHGKNRSYQHCQ